MNILIFVGAVIMILGFWDAVVPVERKPVHDDFINFPNAEMSQYPTFRLWRDYLPSYIICKKDSWKIDA